MFLLILQMNIKKIALLLAGVFLAGSLLALPVPAGAQNTQQLCDGADLKLDSSGSCQTKDKDGNNVSASSKVNKLLDDIVNLFSIIVGIVAVIMIIYGGFRYITSGGDSSKITDARNTILYAIVGLIIVAFAQFVVKFILSKISQS